jgi:hypothetical protein
MGFRSFSENTVGKLNAGVKGTGFTRKLAPPSGFKV